MEGDISGVGAAASFAAAEDEDAVGEVGGGASQTVGGVVPTVQGRREVERRRHRRELRLRVPLPCRRVVDVGQAALTTQLPHAGLRPGGGGHEGMDVEGAGRNGTVGEDGVGVVEDGGRLGGGGGQEVEEQPHDQQEGRHGGQAGGHRRREEARGEQRCYLVGDVSTVRVCCLEGVEWGGMRIERERKEEAACDRSPNDVMTGSTV